MIFLERSFKVGEKSTNKFMANNFQNSLDLFKKAKRKIPLASQTFSKSQISYNFENGPIFLDRGRGAFVWDIDGNKYLDYVIGLLPNILGYNDIDVNRSIVSQLKNGISFSMPTKLEYLLAEMLIDLVPQLKWLDLQKMDQMSLLLQYDLLELILKEIK